MMQIKCHYYKHIKAYILNDRKNMISDLTMYGYIAKGEEIIELLMMHFEHSFLSYFFFTNLN